jgi:hypothetical protein
VHLLDICREIQNSAIGTSIRESGDVFPIVESTHVLALTISVGTVMWFDLRLLGVTMREAPVSDVFRQLRPWMIFGFAVMLATGLTMFWALAENLYDSRYFRIKLVLLALAAANIILFHATIDRRRADWDLQPVPPTSARIAGFVSLVLWAAIIVAGRFTAYNI